MADYGRVPEKSRLAFVVGVYNRNGFRVPHFRQTVGRLGERLADLHRFDVLRPFDRPRPDGGRSRNHLRRVESVKTGKPGDRRTDIGRRRHAREIKAVLVGIVHANWKPARTARPHLVLAVGEGGGILLPRNIIPIIFGEPWIVEKIKRMRSGKNRSDRRRICKRGVRLVCQDDREIAHHRPSVPRILNQNAGH